MGLDAHSFFVDSFSHFGRHKRIGSPVPGTWAERAVHFCVCMSYLHAVFATLDPKVTMSAHIQLSEIAYFFGFQKVSLKTAFFPSQD